MSLQQVLYRTSATSTGGREGTTKANDGTFEMKLTTPKELGGNGAAGANPEQLFAAGYSACFIGALKFVGGRDKIAVPADASINATVGIGLIPAGFGIEVKMDISLPGVDRATAEKLVEEAHKVCPYSNATRGNIDVTLNIV
jgi:Ohr subfamily peroxiredoxin